MPNLSIQKSLSVSEVTIDNVLSRYLWNSPIPPKREDMELSVTHEKRFPIRINAVDYMKNGAGKYASATDFKMFENFLRLGIYLLEKNLILLMRLEINFIQTLQNDKELCLVLKETVLLLQFPNTA